MSPPLAPGGRTGGLSKPGAPGSVFSSVKNDRPPPVTVPLVAQPNGSQQHWDTKRHTWKPWKRWK
jgi:hypothetical protein